MQPKQQDSELDMSPLCSSPLVPVEVVGRMLWRRHSPVGISRCTASFGSRAGPGGPQQRLSPSRGFMRDRLRGAKLQQELRETGMTARMSEKGGGKRGDTGRSPLEMQICSSRMRLTPGGVTGGPGSSPHISTARLSWNNKGQCVPLGKRQGFRGTRTLA